jgi:hypothetical protein
VNRRHAEVSRGLSESAVANFLSSAQIVLIIVKIVSGPSPPTDDRTVN